jgi:transglutaminase-like putative cysteine protease
MKLRVVYLLAFVLALLARIAAAQAFPPITEKERALTAVPGEPNASAVVLFKKAEFLMWGYDSQGAISSRLLVQERRKILTEQGKDLAEVAVAHNDFIRLSGFKGRTVLPDGREVPLGSDARFERKESKRFGRRVTTVAFPSVDVGAILDYQYELRMESIYFLEPWYFSEELPVLYSEMTFKIPREIQTQGWNRDPFKVGLKNETKKSSRGTELRVWGENLPSVPDDPFGLPFADLATQMMIVPAAYQDRDVYEKLMDSWPSVCEMLEEYYGKARRKDGGVGKKAKEIAASGGARQKAEALYRFVRDEIETVNQPGIFLAEGSSVEKTLSQKSGDPAEKALLLQSLLNAVKLDAKVVWAADRMHGQIDPQVPNPLWFDTVLVALDLDGQRVFLDPTDRALAFGRLQYGYEGTPALIHDPKKPEGIVLPEPPHDQNARRAVVDLDLDTEGRLSGKGEVTYTGHHAWQRIDWKDDEVATLEAWKKWLGEEYPGFQIDGVRFEEKPDEQTARVFWTMKQREEDVLGDEASLVPSRPLGPTRQPFVQDASKRRSPVLFLFPDRDEVELRLRWPEGWNLESQPKLASTRNRVGTLTVGLELNDAERSLVYRRQLDVTQRQLPSMQMYEEARALFGAAEKSDAQALVLARR